MAKHKSLKSRITEDIRAGKLRGNSLVESIRKAASLGVDASELKRLCEVSLNKNLAKGKHRCAVYDFVENLEKHGVLETKPFDSSRRGNLAKQNPGAIAAMQELKNAKPQTKEQKRERAKWLKDMLAKPKETVSDPQPAEPKLNPADEPIADPLEGTAFKNLAARQKYLSNREAGGSIFHYKLPSGELLYADGTPVETIDPWILSVTPTIELNERPSPDHILKETDTRIQWVLRS